MSSETLELEADVLVIGGGLAATWAAAAAARSGAQVILADKGWCGTSGVTSQAGPGHWWVPPDPEQRAAAVERQMERSRGLGDPEWMERVLEITFESLPTIASYYDFPRDEHGQLSYKAIRGPEYLRAMRRLIADLGVQILDHSPAIELLLHRDGTVAGASGVRRQEHRDWTVRAGAVVLATGGCAWRSRMIGADCDTGDGLLMATEAGAELSGMEFSSVFSPSPVHSNMTRSLSFAFGSYRDEAGQPIQVDLMRLTDTLAKALIKGRVYGRFDKMPQAVRERLRFVQPAFLVPFARMGIDPFSDWFEVTLRAEGTIRGVGGLRYADGDAQTAVPGLFAAGDVASREPVAGAVSGAGAQSSAWAVTTGQVAGRVAAERAQAGGRRSAEPADRTGRVALSSDAGAERVDLAEIVRAVQAEMFDLDKAMFRTDQKLSASLARLDEIWPSIRDERRADDPRRRVHARETAAMLATARWCLEAARARAESRGIHRRSDLPDEDPRWQRRLTVTGIDRVTVSQENPGPIREVIS